MRSGKDRLVIARRNQVTIDHRSGFRTILGLKHTTYREYNAVVGAHLRSFTTHLTTTSPSTPEISQTILIKLIVVTPSGTGTSGGGISIPGSDHFTLAQLLLAPEKVFHMTIDAPNLPRHIGD